MTMKGRKTFFLHLISRQTKIIALLTNMDCGLEMLFLIDRTSHLNSPIQYRVDWLVDPKVGIVGLASADL